MHIRRLDICGFKSFNERVAISFDEGITGIVGPNGCGKSNVVDALRWVMGEQSARQLRGGAMADLLFNGSERVGPAGMAEVSLTLINDRSSHLPAPYRDLAEINIKRRLYRSGESEYHINREQCRLMDVTELLLGTGAGKRAYSIIEQGKVGLIVNAKPEERRGLLEEAAGISKYRWRKQTAERKLAAAEQNLLRVSDVVAELRRQLGSLERQARKATRYRKLKDALRQLELNAAAISWLGLQARRGHLGRATDESGRVVEECQRDLHALHGERLGHRQLLEQADAALAACIRRQHDLEKELQRSEQLKTFRAREMEDLAQRGETLHDTLASLKDRQNGFSQEGQELEGLLAGVTASVAAADQARTDAEESLATEVSAEAQVRQELDAQRHVIIEASERVSSGTRETAEVNRQLEEVRERLAKLQAEAHQLTERQAELQKKLAVATGFTAETRQLKLRLETERGELELLLGRARSALVTEEEQFSALGQTLAARRSRLQSLIDLRKAYEGYQEGVRSILRAGAEGIGPAGVLSIVADAFQAPAHIETALEAYLGERLQELVVEDGAAALAASSFLREREGGRATFVPLNVVLQAQVATPTGQPGVLGRAADLVRIGSGAEQVVEALLGRAWIVSDLETAIALRASGVAADLVTLGGEILFASGVVTGGTSAEVVPGELHQRREVEELAREVEELRARFGLDQDKIAALRAQIASGEASLRAVSQGSHEKEVSLTHQQQDVRRMTEQLHACEERLSRLGADQAECELADSRMTQSKRAIENQVAQVGSRLAVAKDAAEVLERSLETKSEDVQRAQGRLMEIQVGLAADQERRVAAVARGEKLAEGLHSVEAERDLALEQLATTQSRSEILAKEEHDFHALFAQLQRDADQERAGHSRLASAREERALELAALETKEEVTRTRTDTERQNHSNAQIALRECEMEISHLESMTREVHGLELDQEISRFHLDPLPSVDQEQKLRELRALVAGMGEINLSAIEEHEEIKGRYESLVGQQLDLQQGIAQLREAIARIGRQSQRRFRETFEIVNQRFGEVFPRMFGGGRASLSLVQEDGNLLEGGVEIFAQPPGKKLQSIDLMSGGEKALTAVALVFAIFLTKPTPFCLLDEVDAPLDEVNVGRYLKALREMSGLSQFIVITHNKRTMEAADTLYGVTMEEPGCSKLVSVRLKRPEASAA
jgi:chromosome segregation protein